MVPVADTVAGINVGVAVTVVRGVVGVTGAVVRGVVSTAGTAVCSKVGVAGAVVRGIVGVGVTVLVMGNTTSPEPGLGVGPGVIVTVGGVSKVRVTNWVGVGVTLMAFSDEGSVAAIVVTGSMIATIVKIKERRMYRFFMVIIPDFRLCNT